MYQQHTELKIKHTHYREQKCYLSESILAVKKDGVGLHREFLLKPYVLSLRCLRTWVKQIAAYENIPDMHSDLYILGGGRLFIDHRRLHLRQVR